MRFHWLKLLLLTSFAFWATGAAKYTHELLEHHGHDASVDDDDDDDSPAATTAAQFPVQGDQPPHLPVKHPCPVCQMFAGMVVQPTAPPALPNEYFPLVETLIVANHVAPSVDPAFDQCARGPPHSA